MRNSPAVDLAHFTGQLGWGKGGGAQMWTFLKPILPPPPHPPQGESSPHPACGGELLPIEQAGRGTGHMCKLSAAPPSHCELTLITADRQAPTVT